MMHSVYRTYNKINSMTYIGINYGGIIILSIIIEDKLAEINMFISIRQNVLLRE